MSIFMCDWEKKIKIIINDIENSVVVLDLNKNNKTILAQ